MAGVLCVLPGAERLRHAAAAQRVNRILTGSHPPRRLLPPQQPENSPYQTQLLLPLLNQRFTVMGACCPGGGYVITPESKAIDKYLNEWKFVLQEEIRVLLLGLISLKAFVV